MPDAQEFLEQERKKIALCSLASAGAIFEDGEEIEKECPCCERIGLVTRRRINTQYADDERNWFLACRDCHEETIEYYKELWDVARS